MFLLYIFIYNSHPNIKNHQIDININKNKENYKKSNINRLQINIIIKIK